MSYPVLVETFHRHMLDQLIVESLPFSSGGDKIAWFFEVVVCFMSKQLLKLENYNGPIM